MTEYDLAQREQLRQTLLAYMKEHKIGVPRLAARIKETVHRNPEIPVKTLQRFMKGEVRTIDMHVGFLGQFVNKISKVDPLPRLGSALSAFYTPESNIDLTGTFRLSDGLHNNDPEWGELSKIEVMRVQDSWRVKETHYKTDGHRIYDGVLTFSNITGVIVLRERLSGLPRFITLCRRIAGSYYAGVATAAYESRTLKHDFPTSRVATRYGPVSLRAEQ
jgi:hypothetical protein